MMPAKNTTDTEFELLWKTMTDIANWVIPARNYQFDDINDEYLNRLSEEGSGLFDKVRKEVERIESLRRSSTVS